MIGGGDETDVVKLFVQATGEGEARPAGAKDNDAGFSITGGCSGGFFDDVGIGDSG